MVSRGGWSWLSLGVLALGGCAYEIDLGSKADVDPAPAKDIQTEGCLAFETPQVDFGAVPAGDTRVQSVSITNRCGIAVEGGSCLIDGDTAFVLPDKGASGWVLGPHSSRVVGVGFYPVQAALARGELRCISDTESASVLLLGNSAGPCVTLSRTSVNFGCLLTDVTGWQGVELRSCGEGPLTLGSAELVQAADGPFALKGLNGGEVLSSGAALTFSVGFQAGADDGLVPPQWQEAEVRVVADGYAEPLIARLRGFGKTYSCEGLKVALVWVTPGDPDPKDTGFEAGSDLDLHLLHPFGVGYFDIPFDASWFNASPAWGALDDSRDDPLMHRDDFDGLGPETITLELPEDGRTYGVGVHYWEDNAFGPIHAQVQVWIFGELAYESPFLELIEGQLWEAAEITWPEGTVSSGGDLPDATIHTAFPVPCGQIPCGK